MPVCTHSQQFLIDLGKGYHEKDVLEKKKTDEVLHSHVYPPRNSEFQRTSKKFAFSGILWIGIRMAVIFSDR